MKRTVCGLACLMVAGAAFGGDLPAEYDELEWVESTGSQWIDTGVVPGVTTSVEMRFGNVAYAEGTALFGQRWNGGQYLLNMQQGHFWFHGGGSRIRPVVANTNWFVSVVGGKVSLAIEGAAATNVVAENLSAANANMAVFGCIDGSRLAKFRLHSLKIWKDGKPVRDYLPCRERAGEGRIGLYDLASGAFFPPKGKDGLRGGEVVLHNFVRVDGEPEPFGVPEPGYGKVTNLVLGASIAFRAPAVWTNAAGTLETTCLGWRYERRDGTVEEGDGSEKTLKFGEPDFGARLAWRWRKRPLKHYAVSPEDDLAAKIIGAHDYAVLELAPGEHALSGTVAVSNEIAILGAPDGHTTVLSPNAPALFVDCANARVEGVTFTGPGVRRGPRGGEVTNCFVRVAASTPGAEAGFGGGSGLDGGFVLFTNRAQLARLEPAEWRRCNSPYAAYEWIGDTKASAEPRVTYTVSDGMDYTLWSRGRCWIYRGEIQLDAGETAFALEMDDGGWLEIDGKRLIGTENSWRGEATVTCAEAGWHAFRIGLWNVDRAAGPCGNSGGMGFAMHGPDEKWRRPEDMRYRRSRVGSLQVATGPAPLNAVAPEPGVYFGAVGETGLVCRASATATNETSGIAYRVKGWRILKPEGGEVVAEGEGAQVVVECTGREPRRLEWTWEPVAYRVKAEKTVGGTVEPEEGWYPAGATVKLTAKPDSGYSFYSWRRGVPMEYKLEPDQEFEVEKPLTVAAEFLKKRTRGKK